MCAFADSVDHNTKLLLKQHKYCLYSGRDIVLRLANHQHCASVYDIIVTEFLFF